MSRLEEVLISTSVGKSADGDEGGVRVWNPLSGQQYAGFSGNSSGKEGLSFVPSRRRQGAATCASDYVVAAQVQKPLIKYWQWGRDEVLMRCATPEKIRALCLTPRVGSYVIGGGASGRLYIWSVVTGKLHRVWEGHYRDVSVVQVSADGAMLVSASSDATIQLWSLADLLDRTVAAASLHAVKPLRVWKGHSLAVTGLHLSSVSTAAGLRVFSCAMDQTLRVWDAHAARAAVTFTCPDVLHALAVDPEERCVYLGGGGGDVFRASLELGGSLADWLRRDAKPQHRFRAHEAAVTCLAVSMGGLHLATGSTDKTLKVWDVATLQILQTFKGHQAHGPVSAVRFLLRPRGLFAKERAESLVPLGRLSNFVDDQHQHSAAAAGAVCIRLRAQLPEMDSGLGGSSGAPGATAVDMLTPATGQPGGGGAAVRRKRCRAVPQLAVDLTGVGRASAAGAGGRDGGGGAAGGVDKQQKLEEIHRGEMAEVQGEVERLQEQVEAMGKLNAELQAMLGQSLRADR